LIHGTIPLGAQHTTDTAGNLPDNKVFSRPEFLLKAVSRHFHAGFGAGSVLTVRRRHGCIHVLKPSPIFAINRQLMVFEAHTGVKTMTIFMPKTGTQSPTSRKSATEKKPTHCPRCNESGMFCFCDIDQQIEKAKALEVKRLKRGTFLFSFGGAK
jgi:hypothetical protein